VQIRKLHDWDLDYATARRLQERLARRVRLKPLPRGIELVAGADMAFSRTREKFFACVVVMSLPDLEEVETRHAVAASSFPYIPGLLSFREGPVVLEAFRQLEHTPDAVIFDGQGIAHPRRFGLASHMGLWLGIPTVGCAKSRLVGEHDAPGLSKGDRVPLLDGGERIGVALRTRTGVKPVFVSPGAGADFDGSCRLVLNCCNRYRLPEPTRQAHLKVKQAKAAFLANGPCPPGESGPPRPEQ